MTVAMPNSSPVKRFEQKSFVCIRLIWKSDREKVALLPRCFLRVSIRICNLVLELPVQTNGKPAPPPFCFRSLLYFLGLLYWSHLSNKAKGGQILH